MSEKITIRKASETDAKEILAVYSLYVTDTAITFEHSVPSVTEFAHRIRNTLKKYPYIVAVEEERIIGFAYASALFGGRAAYDRSVETSLYVKKDCKGKGAGKKLYLALEDILKHQNILNLNACVAYTPVEDEHLNNSSTAFHQRLGYSEVGHFTKCGYKFDKWYDIVWMEKMIGTHPDKPAQFIPITEIELCTTSV